LPYTVFMIEKPRWQERIIVEERKTYLVTDL
jgi:hypothetical protein